MDAEMTSSTSLLSTTYVSGSMTLTGTAALAAISAASAEDATPSTQAAGKSGLSSFAIVGECHLPSLSPATLISEVL